MAKRKRINYDLQLFVGGFTSYLRYLYLFAWCPTPTMLCFCFVFLRLVYPMLPVSLDCPFLIAPSVFSNVYLSTNYIQKYKDWATPTPLETRGRGQLFFNQVRAYIWFRLRESTHIFFYQNLITFLARRETQKNQIPAYVVML